MDDMFLLISLVIIIAIDSVFGLGISSRYKTKTVFDIEF